MEKFKIWICALDKLKVFPLVDFTFSLHGVVKGDRVLNAIKEFVPDTNIEDLKIDFSASAADISNHKEIIYRTGSIYDAIRASIAIPMVLTPVITKDSVIVDGGVLNNIPISNVKRNEGDLLVSVYVNADIEPLKLKHQKKEEKQQKSVYLEKINEFYEYLNIVSSKTKKERLSYFSLLDKTFISASLQLAQFSIEKGAPYVLVNVSRHVCGTYDFYMAEDLIEIGRMAMAQTLDKFDKSKKTSDLQQENHAMDYQS